MPAVSPAAIAATPSAARLSGTVRPIAGRTPVLTSRDSRLSSSASSCSGRAAWSLALFILMLPIVIRATEEMLKLVPTELREASYALGVPKWRTILRVVLPTALAGIITGVMLGVARIAGETAPLLLLVGINQKIEFNPFAGTADQNPQASLPTFIYEQFGVAVGNTSSPAFQRAWGAALVLIIIIGLLSLLARLIARFARVRG